MEGKRRKDRERETVRDREREKCHLEEAVEHSS